MIPPVISSWSWFAEVGQNLPPVLSLYSLSTLRASTGQYESNPSTTVGVDYRTLELGMGSVLGVLQLWDTAGQERFRSITRQYYR